MNEAKSNGKRKFQAYGPWATALDTGPGAALSTFWRRRMAMLSTLNTGSGRASWRLRIVLAAGGLMVLALPGLYLSRAQVAQAELAEVVEPAGAAEPTGVSEPTEVAKPAPAPDETPKAEPRARILLPPDAPGPWSTPTPVAATIQSAKAIPEPSVEYFPEPTEVEKRINEALSKRATFEFVEMPLKSAVAFLMDTLGNEVEILLDNRALEDAGVGGDTTVNLKAKNVPIRSALRLLLGQKDLTYLIQDEVLLITTVDKAETQLVTRTYPIGDLLADVPVMIHKGGMGGKSDGKTPPEQTGKFEKDYDSLIDCITSTVVPPSWDEVGGPGSITEMSVSSSVVISQTPVVHDEVLQLFRALRAAKRASGG